MDNKPKKKDYVLIIGSSNMDLNIYSKRLPEPGETVTGGRFEQSLGGKGANQAVASKRSGAQTNFIAKIGDDSFGAQMEKNLTNEGIVTHFIKDPHTHSGVAFILIDNRGENMISVAPGANFNLKPEDIKNKEAIIKNAKVLVVQMEIPIETIGKIFNIANKSSTIKILNPAPLKFIPDKIIKKIDIIVPNEGELFKLFSLLDLSPLDKEDNKITLIKKISRAIASKGLKYVITTLGSEGSLLYSAKDDKTTKIPSYKVQAVDTVGAGDCFIGVLAGKLSQSKKIIESIEYGTCAASIAVTRKGAQKSMPFEEEIEIRMKEYKQRVNF